MAILWLYVIVFFWRMEQSTRKIAKKLWTDDISNN